MPALDRWASLTTAIPCMAAAEDLTHPLVCLATILRHILQLPDYLVVGPWGRFAASCTPGLSA